MPRSTVVGFCKTRSMRFLIAAFAVMFLAVPPAQAKHHKKRHRTPTPVAGTFDYYVLSLSWSPQHCATSAGGAGDLQCGSSRKFGFVLHGLWPQYETGYPQSCAPGAQLTNAVVDSILDIMPSTDLVHHEWSKHGTCSGLTPEEYFAKARAAFSAVKIPAPYNDPTTASQTSISKLKQSFRATNPDLDGNEMTVECSGKFLQEVRVCFDKDLHARACGHDVRDACHGGITVRPVK